MKPILKVYKIGELEIPNPIVVASCPATEDMERLLRCADAGAGAAVLKSCHTIKSMPTDQGGRRFQKSVRGLWGTSTLSRELLHPEMGCSLLEDVQKRSNLIVIPSIAAFFLDFSDWLETLRIFEPYNPPCVQLDFFYLQEDLSLSITQNRLRNLINHLRQKSHLHLLPKLNQEIRPGAAIELFEGTGISGWSVLDSLRTHLPKTNFLHEAGFPDSYFTEEAYAASLFGYWQLPIVCEYVYRLRKSSSLSILAGGGVRNFADIMQLLSLGANAVQVATSIIQEGPGWIRRAIDDLNSYGLGEDEHQPTQQFREKVRVQIDNSLCTSCGSCSRQLMCTSIEMTAHGPTILKEKCEGCGFCLTLCPEKALSLSIE